MPGFLIFEFGVAIAYFFVGLLIGYIAKSRGWLYALMPALLIRSAQMFPTFNTPLIRLADPVNPMLPIFAVGSALFLSYLGGLVGGSLKKIKNGETERNRVN